ncbi:MAG: hypothetical protein ACI4P7_07425 [Bacilli bacterium]|nr:hypothetical protein [Mollicutes bacterium]
MLKNQVGSTTLIGNLPIDVLITNETNRYFKYVYLKQSLLESGNNNHSLIEECDKKMCECESNIAYYNEILTGENPVKPNINRRVLIRREAYNG